jgi:hypothetical protein
MKNHGTCTEIDVLERPDCAAPALDYPGCPNHHLRRLTPAKPAVRISRATRLRPT